MQSADYFRWLAATQPYSTMGLNKISLTTADNLFPYGDEFDNIDSRCATHWLWYNMFRIFFQWFLSKKTCKYLRYFWDTWLWWPMALFLWWFSWPCDPTNPSENCEQPADALLCFLLDIGDFMLFPLLPILLVLTCYSCFSNLIHLYWEIIKTILWVFWDSVKFIVVRKHRYLHLIYTRIETLRERVQL